MADQRAPGRRPRDAPGGPESVVPVGEVIEVVGAASTGEEVVEEARARTRVVQLSP